MSTKRFKIQVKLELDQQIKSVFTVSTVKISARIKGLPHVAVNKGTLETETARLEEEKAVGESGEEDDNEDSEEGENSSYPCSQLFPVTQSLICIRNLPRLR